MSYGKFFASCFNGSMVGAGPTVFAVWGYVIAHAVDGQVELNPKLLAVILGCDREDIDAALSYLCSPDPDSRNRAEGGRRLVQEGQFAYRVVSHAVYRQMRNEDERREYNRLKQREHRAKRKGSLTVNDMSALSAQAETETETETEAEPPRKPPKGGGVPDAEAEAVYAEYPWKVGKPKALAAIRRAIKADGFDLVLEATKRYAGKVAEWDSEDRCFVPHPATWFNQQRYNDDPETWQRSSAGNGSPGRHHEVTPSDRRNAEMGLSREDVLRRAQDTARIVAARTAARDAEWEAQGQPLGDSADDPGG